MQSTCIVETTGHFIGAKYWRLNNGLGGLHRDEIDPETGLTLHAVEYPGGNKEWWQNDILHRDDGPAVEYADGFKWWYLNGKLHREDINPETGLTMPAVEYTNGTKEWYLNGNLHRKDGPAVEFADGRTYYYINGNYIPQLDNKRIYGKEKLAIALLLM